MNKKVFIYSDKIKSGKTTKLFQWMTKQNSIGGILQPVVEERRFFYSIIDKKLIQLEITKDQSKNFSENELIKIGNYFFLRSGFEKAKEILRRDFNNKPEFLIVDEIGPLELEGNGLEPIVSEILDDIGNFEGKLILVIRDKILVDAVKKYNLEEKFEIW
ncbi:MAG: nucleoside-triphosphatase [Ignavibacteria bacterium]